MAGQNRTDLTANEAMVARLLAEDTQSDGQIAAAVGIARSTLAVWKKRPDIQARIAEHREAFKDAALTEGFADKRARLAILNSTAQDIARWMADNAYERTEVKVAANGEAIEYKIFDKARYDSLRGALDDIAKEMGERGTNVNLTGDPDRPLVLGIVGIPLDEV